MTKRPTPAALPLLEDAVRLLRAAPPAVLVLHALGSVPCLLYAVFFYTDLSRSAFAAGHLIGSSLVLAALYAWMKCWQAISVAHLRASLLGQPAPTWDAARLTRLIAAQVLLQPAGLILRLIASIVALPYVWVATCFQNVTILGDGTAAGVGEVAATSWQEARRWPGRAHALAGYLLLFGLFIFLNLLALLAFIPMLLKSLLGIETVFSRYALGLLNPTTFVAVFAMTYLCLDPLRKAAVLLRCFHGRSLRTGEDLAVEIQRLRRPTPALAALLATAFLLSPLTLRAEDPRPPVEATQLDRSIDGVLDRREFTWRSPPGQEAPVDSANLSPLQKWIRDVMRSSSAVLWKVGRWMKRWLEDLLERRGEPSSSGRSFAWLGSVQLWFWIVLAASAAIVVVLILRRGRRARGGITQAIAIEATPDLREESVTADQLPEDGWLRLAAELLDRGEYRLALRAFYLAGLAHLGGRELIHLARHKSNRDYDRELRRRARTQGELLAAFDRNLRVFESAWYGDHAVDAAALRAVSANLDRIRAC